MLAVNPWTMELKRYYGFECILCQPQGQVWKVHTHSGVFLMKKTSRSPEQLFWLADSIETLNKAGFRGLIPLVRTRTHRPYCDLPGRRYIVMPWVNGTHPSFANPNHWKRTAALLANLHRTAQRALPSEAAPPNLLEIYRGKRQFLQTLADRLKAMNGLNRIDRGILRWSRHFLAQADIALELLESHPLAKEPGVRREAGFCHKDPAPRNIIIQGSQWVLIDYELAAVDWFPSELATFIRRVMAANDWRDDCFELICEAYHRERPLTEDAKTLIRILLCFPQPFWRLCNQRFEERLSWTEGHFQRKFWHLFDEEPRRAHLLQRWFPAMPLPAAGAKNQYHTEVFEDG